MKNFNPLIFLKSLGAGGLAISFFMYLMFMTKHKAPIPTFDTLKVYFVEHNILYIALILFAIIWLLFFAIKHIYVLIKELKNYIKFKKTEEFHKIKDTNKEVTLMSIPLTLAMTMNVLFSLSAVFIPNLRNHIEYIFPFALLWFLVIWIYALYIYWEYFSRIMTKGNFEIEEGNNLSQMIAAFAFSMVWVWFAWPAAMSQTAITSTIATILSIFFLTITFILVLIKLLVGFKEMFRKWVDIEWSSSLWIMIPILTLFWISLVRNQHGIAHISHQEVGTIGNFLILTIIISAQLIFGRLWYKVMRMNKYFRNYINWEKNSVASYSLICPWVALTVLWFFFVHKWLIENHIISKFGIAYFVILLPIIYTQFITIRTLFKLNRKMK